MLLSTSNLRFCDTHSIVGWYAEYKYVPSVNDIVQKVYSPLPDPTTDKAKYDDHVALRIWYFDKYLPPICNETHFGKVHRRTKMAIETNKDTGMHYVETIAEAFAWTLLENFRQKWVAICEDWVANYNAASGKKYSPPEYKNQDKNTWVYHVGKWTNPYSGQGKGWDPAARIACNAYKAQIYDIRRADKKDDWRLHKSFLALLQEHHKVGPDGLPLKKKKASKKKAAPVPAAAAHQKVVLDDACDSDFDS